VAETYWNPDKHTYKERKDKRFKEPNSRFKELRERAAHLSSLDDKICNKSRCFSCIASTYNTFVFMVEVQMQVDKRARASHL